MSRGGFRWDAGRPRQRLAIETCRRADARRPPAGTFKLISVPCRFGGTRPMLLCARCGRRQLFLYLPPGQWHYACRRCLGASYPSQSDNPLRRLQRRLRKLAARLGPSHARPRGMRWRTFLRLRDHISSLEQEIEALIYGRLGRELADLKRRP